MRPPKPISDKDRESLGELLKRTKSKADFQRVQCVWLRAALGMNSTEIATAIGWSSGRVKQVQASYFAEGESALIGVGRGGRRHENLSVEREEALLESFIEKSKAGGVLVVSELKATYEAAVGHKVPKSTVYRMLARHGWRKVAPRPRHPKATPEEVEAFKKNSPSLWRKKSPGRPKKGRPSG